MARSTWWQQCCTAAFDACSCTSAGRSGGCSSSPWCQPPASPGFKIQHDSPFSLPQRKQLINQCLSRNFSNVFSLWFVKARVIGKSDLQLRNKMRSLLPCFPEDPSTPHCSRPTSPRAAWSPPSARRPPRSTCRAECRCTPQPLASSRGDTQTRCIFRPIILWACYHFSNIWWCYFFVLGKGKESVWVSRSRRDWGNSCCLRPLIKANKA